MEFFQPLRKPWKSLEFCNQPQKAWNFASQNVAFCCLGLENLEISTDDHMGTIFHHLTCTLVAFIFFCWCAYTLIINKKITLKIAIWMWTKTGILLVKKSGKPALCANCLENTNVPSMQSYLLHSRILIFDIVFL